MCRYIKIGSAGEQLPRDAASWVAVLDTTTGLMWSVETKKVANWKKAGGAAKKIKAAGFDDWRLPSRNELITLTDLTRINPAIDTDFFPDTPNDWFWSTTPYASSPSGCAWYVGFGGGDANWGGQSYDGFVRAVRVGQGI